MRFSLACCVAAVCAAAPCVHAGQQPDVDLQHVLDTLQSRRGETFRVEDVRPGSDALSARRSGDGDVPGYVVTFRPATAGEFKGTVSFMLSTASGRRHTVEVPVAAYVLGRTLATKAGEPGESG